MNTAKHDRIRNEQAPDRFFTSNDSRVTPVRLAVHEPRLVRPVGSLARTESWNELVQPRSEPASGTSPPDASDNPEPAG